MIKGSVRLSLKHSKNAWLLHNNISKPCSILFSNKAFFAKEGGKKPNPKEQKKEEIVEEDPNQKLMPHEKMINYFTSPQPSLSPSEEESLSKLSEELSEEEREILDKLAQKMCGLNTSVFYDLYVNKESFGLSSGYFMGSSKFQEEQIKEAVQVLRKDV